MNKSTKEIVLDRSSTDSSTQSEEEDTVHSFDNDLKRDIDTECKGKP